MASFYYYDHNPPEYCSLAQIKDFCYLNPTGTTKFKYERAKELNCGLSSNNTSSCKWPIVPTKSETNSSFH